ncbi:MAG: Clp protease N-terminal domain-containing protein [Acidimicrobiales bacterium]
MTTEFAAPEVLHPWSIYLQASEEARRRGDRRTGTDHILLALFEDPSIEAVLGVSLQQARHAIDSLDHEALAALGLGSGADAPALAMRAVPKKPRIRDIAKKDRFGMTPAAKNVLEGAYKPKGHRKLQVTGPEVLAQILALQPPDPAVELLGALGVNSSEVRRRIDEVTNLVGDAAPATPSDTADPFNGRPRR